jgi:hypothetical protein
MRTGLASDRVGIAIGHVRVTFGVDVRVGINGVVGVPHFVFVDARSRMDGWLADRHGGVLSSVDKCSEAREAVFLLARRSTATVDLLFMRTNKSKRNAEDAGAEK